MFYDNYNNDVLCIVVNVIMTKFFLIKRNIFYPPASEASEQSELA